MTKTKICLTIIALSLIIIYLEIKSVLSFGFLINKFFPCEQNQLDSLPCFFVYDVYFIYTLITFILISIIVLILDLIKK